MDPISIITAAASLAGAVFAASLKIKNTLDQLDDAPQNVSDVAEEVYAVRYALGQVEDVVRRDPDVVERLALADVFSLAVGGCHATLLRINEEYERLFARSDWKARVQALWKDGEMTRLLSRLDRKKATLTLLTQTLNLRSTQDIKDLLVQNQSTLVAAIQDLREPLPYESRPRAAISGPVDDDTVNSVYGDNESVLSTTEFDFDFDLINTKTYRRALARAQSRAKGSPVDTNKPLPEVQGGDSPRSLEPVAEDTTEDVADTIDLSGDTLASQYTLSRATTLLPETEGSTPTTPTASSDKQVQSMARIESGGEAKPAATSTTSLVSEDPNDEKMKNASSKKPNKHEARRRLRLEEAAARAEKKRSRGGRPPLLAHPPGFHSTPSLASDGGGMGRVGEQPARSASEGTVQAPEKPRHRHKCGRRADARLRSCEGNIPDIIAKAQRARGPRGLPGPVEAVEEAVRQLGISDSTHLRGGRGRQR
ncbi:hypothetical protein CSOJ01_06523 [Colletotrichum sojae]|uniref:Fungal N-terminal domain-containing protein n=1 Tax=Colletotrichum sojae TaxID=2175907 RepID=A0A8H6JCJ7_9PEZI|nr:hypothetical protein CSOJ01_06523 [Colletotrichum sojae]